MASYYNENTVIFLDGSFVKASEAKIDLYSQSMHYGYAVFEGIRSYKTVSGETKIFQEQEQVARLKHSADSWSLHFDHKTVVLIAATHAILTRNNLQDAYSRPLVY